VTSVFVAKTVFTFWRSFARPVAVRNAGIRYRMIYIVFAYLLYSPMIVRPREDAWASKVVLVVELFGM
jgi:hypothetical protein